jgi:PadR family transcriptional regulator PadR
MPDAPRKVAQGPMAHVELQILLALSRGPCHGYELMREIARSTAGLIAPGPGTLYVALRRLADGGAISEQDRAAGQQSRRRYRITSSGRTALSRELSRLARLLRQATKAGWQRGLAGSS